MTPIRPDRTAYAIERRYASKKGGSPLKDHNSNTGTMPFNTVQEVARFVADEIVRNYAEHFAQKP